MPRILPWMLLLNEAITVYDLLNHEVERLSVEAETFRSRLS